MGMDLNKAKWCTDCGEIYQGDACPSCGSTVYWWMSKRVRVMGASPARSLHRASRSEHMPGGRQGPRRALHLSARKHDRGTRASDPDLGDRFSPIPERMACPPLESAHRSEG